MLRGKRENLNQMRTTMEEKGADLGLGEREGGKPKHICVVIRHGSDMPVFTCYVVLLDGQAQTEVKLGISLMEGAAFT